MIVHHESVVVIVIEESLFVEIRRTGSHGGCGGRLHTVHNVMVLLLLLLMLLLLLDEVSASVKKCSFVCGCGHGRIVEGSTMVER